MQSDDVNNFANTLADGFREYDLFKQACGKKYSIKKMRVFWAVTIALNADNAICIADSKEANSVLVYIRPKAKDPGLIRYLKAGGLRMITEVGLKSAIRLLRFDIEAHKIAEQYKAENDGYILSFATRIDKQGQHYGKPLIEALLRYLDMSGEGCYLETLKASNVELYKHFTFELVGKTPLKTNNLTLYAMRRPQR